MTDQNTNTDRRNVAKSHVDRLRSYMSFLQSCESLKDTLRSGKTKQGRQESTAEHTWRLCLFGMLMETEFPDLDHLKIQKLCLVHDLGEAVSGDVPAPEQTHQPCRKAQERDDFIVLCSDLPTDMQQVFIGLYDEYAAAQTPEAKLVKALDKLETMMQHLIGNDEPDFDFKFNLQYGRQYTDMHPTLAAIRELVDKETRSRLKARG